MLQIFAKFRTGNPTAADIRGALAALDLEGASKVIARAEEARRTAIVSGDEAGVGRAEQVLVKARLERERLDIARAELESRLADAIASEAGARLDKVQADAERQRDQARARLAKEGVAAMRALCAILSEVAAADEAVTRANGQLVAAGRPAIATVESDFTPVPENQYGPLHHVAGNVCIPRVDGWQISGWNYSEPPFNHGLMLASAFPPGSTGDRGDMPRAVVLRPGGASATW
ncbi:MAG: hypothetical protein JNM13_04910 [Hyphomicrobiaceae bacterium]|nr:hypothetical protein [Hyphomicrobiaceae bacterium]